MTCKITAQTAPKFAWRGYMLDVSRHFFTAEDVKRTLDLMREHDLNVFHWHLTDSQGWRLQIDRYPKLTEIGAVRKASTKRETTMGLDVVDGDYGPFFYTKDQVREIVAYAADRGIRIVPEIEIPGHSAAAIRAYPELGCTKSGYCSEYCLGKESTFEFLQNVLDEVVELFPGDVIHIGGDECQGRNWKECADCQARIRELGLKDTHDLQGWATRRFAAYLEKKGRRLMGWDELAGWDDLPRSVIVQSYRGASYGVAAAKKGFDVVMSPDVFCYLDYVQGLENDPEEYQPFGVLLDVAKIARFDPCANVPEECRKHILGGQGNLWTELVPDRKAAEWRTWPRLAAIADVLKNGPAKDLPAFMARMQSVRDDLVRRGVNAAPLGPLFKPVPDLLPGARYECLKSDNGKRLDFAKMLDNPLDFSVLRFDHEDKSDPFRHVFATRDESMRKGTYRLDLDFIRISMSAPDDEGFERGLAQLRALARPKRGGAMEFTGAVIAGGPPGAEPPADAAVRESLDPYVPVVWRRHAVKETADELLAIHRQSGLRRFLVAGPGFNEVMYAPFPADLYAEMGREIGEIAGLVSADGIEVGWWCSPSIRYFSSFASVEDAFGGKSADNKKCPLDPAFQDDWTAKVKSIVAAARPRMIAIEDDYTLAWGRGLQNGGCFCKRHLALFAEIYGKSLAADEIAAAFENRSDANLPIRRAFADTVRESLRLLARKVREAVDEVDPSIRIMLCEPGGNADKDGASTEAVARAFAGPDTRPAIRPSGAIYGAQTTPADIPGALAHTFHTLGRLPRDIETFYEADPYPHNRFFTSAAQLGSLSSGAVFAGSRNLLLYCLQYLDDPFEDPGYANEFNRLKPRLEAVRDFNLSRRASLRGVRVIWKSDALSLTRGLGGGRDAQLADEAFILAKFGLPYTMDADAKGPAILAGNIVESLTDGELERILSGGVLVDAPAAGLLVQRGFGRDLGTDVEVAPGRLPITREEILPAAGLTRRGRDVNAFYIFNAGTEGTVHTFAKLAPHEGAEVWSRFSGPGGKPVTPSLTVAENRRGGRVAVLATSLLGNRSSGLLNLRKQELWRNLFRKLAPNALPVMALDAPGIWTLASVSEDGREMMVMVNNLSGDVREGQAFVLSDDWAGATIARLGADGREEEPETLSARWTPKCVLGQMQPEFFHVAL